MGDGLKKVATAVVGVTIGATTDLLVSAVSHTPVLKIAVQTYVHRCVKQVDCPNAPVYAMFQMKPPIVCIFEFKDKNYLRF